MTVSVATIWRTLKRAGLIVPELKETEILLRLLRRQAAESDMWQTPRWGSPNAWPTPASPLHRLGRVFVTRDRLVLALLPGAGRGPALDDRNAHGLVAGPSGLGALTSQDHDRVVITWLASGSSPTSGWMGRVTLNLTLAARWMTCRPRTSV